MSEAIKVLVTVPTFKGWKFDRVGQPDRGRGERYVSSRGELIQPDTEQHKYSPNCLVYVKDDEYRKATMQDGYLAANGDPIEGRTYSCGAWYPCQIVGISAHTQTADRPSMIGFWCVVTNERYKRQETVFSQKVEVLVK